MRLPNIDEMYPQDDGKVHGECTYCGTEIFVGEFIATYNGYSYCDRICVATDLISSGEIRLIEAKEELK